MATTKLILGIGLALLVEMISSRFVGLTGTLDLDLADVPSPDFEPVDT
jgi:hypothetical protein